jgi:signal peptidase I
MARFLVVVFLLYIAANIFYAFLPTIQDKYPYLLPDPLLVPVRYSACCGSMYPTLPKDVAGSSPGFNFSATPSAISRFFKKIIINRDDIVSFDSAAVRAASSDSGLIKRVIGTPGDTLEIRDGQIYINGTPQKEGYVARARSTFGGSFISECKPITIPPHKYFVLGDNRKSSLDSRVIGLVDENDIQQIIPLSLQIGHLDSHWHDPSHDTEDSARIELDKTAYVALLNDIRKKSGIPPLKFNTRLETSATLRGQAILKYDDFSTQATISGYPLVKSLADAGYSNITWGEDIIQGYYDAGELIDYDQNFPKLIAFLKNPDFQDIGIAEVYGMVNGCPTQVIVRHFGGYVPPNYSKSLIDNWQSALDQQKSVQDGWKSLETYPDFYAAHKDKIDQLNQLISNRITLLESIVSTMKANKWVKDSDFAADQPLVTQINSLADELNSSH